MSKPLIQIVDSDDKPVGSATIQEAHTKGLIQQISRIMIEDEQGNILLQKRSANKGLYPGRWDNSVAGHVDAGENYNQAALREMEEEIGLSGIELQELGHFYTEFKADWRILNQFQTAYRAVVPRGTAFRLEADEVEAVQWFTRQEIADLIANHPEKVTNGLLAVFKRFYQ
jgi:16S rRNA (adenine1518-N6/adenine1519-N6)-dimethyltransferase